MCNRFKASFEFREIKLRWDLINDLPQFKPIYNVSPGRKDADILAICYCVFAELFEPTLATSLRAVIDELTAVVDCGERA